MWLRELASRLLLGNARVLWRSAGFHGRWSAELLRREEGAELLACRERALGGRKALGGWVRALGAGE